MNSDMEKAREHDLKVWPDYFDAVASGEKPFEVRFDDRGYSVGDTLRLREYAPGPDRYTGREITRIISYKLDGENIPFGAAAIKPGYCVLGLRSEALEEAVRLRRALANYIYETTHLATPETVGGREYRKTLIPHSAITEARQALSTTPRSGAVQAVIEALEPFADVDGEGDEDCPDEMPVVVRFGRTTHYGLSLGDFRRARAALDGTKEMG